MEKKYQCSTLSGKIRAPFSKSYTQRAIALALLAKGETQILNPAICDDTFAAISLAKGLGSAVKTEKNKLVINGDFKKVSAELSAGESGLALRMFSPIAALLENKINIAGVGSLLKRPVSMMESPLISLGVKFKSNNGFLPIQIQGPLKGGSITIDGSLGSQFLTGLLISLPLANEDSILTVNNLQSIPYINMTLEIINDFGVNIENINHKKFIIKGNQNYKATNYTVEGDWSNGAFLLVGGAISGHVEVFGLNPHSKQADIAILKALNLAGAKIMISGNSIVVIKSELRGFEFDATHCPDLFPPLVILAAACKGKSTLKGTQRLIHKESNRAIVLQTEMGKIGIKIELEGNNMIVHESKITGGDIHSNNDHRIAMAGAIAALRSKNPITIQHAEAINKSYPGFYMDFESLISS